jgi:hypothetical protein
MIRPVRLLHTSGAVLVAALLAVVAVQGAASQPGRAADDKDDKVKPASKAGDGRPVKKAQSAADDPASTPKPSAPSTSVSSANANVTQAARSEGGTTLPPAGEGVGHVEESAAGAMGEDSRFDVSSLVVWGGAAVLALALCGAGVALYRLWGRRRTFSPAPPFPNQQQSGHAGRGTDEPHPMVVDPFGSGPATVRAPRARSDGDPRFAEVLAEIHTLSQKVESLQGELRSSVQAISRDLDAVSRRASVVEEPRPQGFYFGASHEPAPTASAAMPAPAAPSGSLQFPALVSECLRVIKQTNLAVSVAARGVAPGSLQPSDGGTNAAFLIVPNGSSASEFYALPRKERLGEEQDFYTFFLHHYACASVAAGELIVEAPAVVRKSGNEWLLSTKGTLAIRS